MGMERMVPPVPAPAMVDWLPPVGAGIVGHGHGYGYSSLGSSAPAIGTTSSYSGNIGYSTGGAKDINNFRQNIELGYLPIPTDVTCEGLFYDYFFNTGQQKECQELFCPSYNLAVSSDPFSDEVEYFMSVGLNSGIKESDFQRKKLNLVIVLDVSGSMGSPFDSYYYDRFGNRHEVGSGEDSSKAKIQVATESIVELMDHLNGDDRFGMVTFADSASVVYPLELIGDRNIQKMKNAILGIQADGSTNLDSGMQQATEILAPYRTADPAEYENRIIFLTDAMPNTGDTTSSGLLDMAKRNAQDKIFSTFIGIGVDFNTELVEYITKIKGANYYSVNSATEFKNRMDKGFEYMVTPLVFNLELNMASTGFAIEKVYGSPEANEATGQLMKINTLFPSETNEEGTKGGIVILKLRKLAGESQEKEGSGTALTLSVSYEDRLGKVQQSTETVTFGTMAPEYFDNTGMRKAILLSRYANLLCNWIRDERTGLMTNKSVDSLMSYEHNSPCIPLQLSDKNSSSGTYRCIPPTSPVPLSVPVDLGQWERQSVNLQVSQSYKQLFTQFKTYFESEMAAVGDATLSQEVDVLKKLSTYAK